MRGMRNGRRLGGLIVLGLSCLAGCHLPGRASKPKGPLPMGNGEATVVTRAQEADMQFALGRAAERRGDLDQAQVAYEEALKRDKRRADAYQRLAILHDRRGEFGRSAELYRQALAADPGNADIYCDMGYSLYLQRRWAEAERNLRQAIVLRPDLTRAHNNLGLVLAHDHRSEEALAEYLKAGNDEAASRSNLALAMTLDGRYDEARDQYRKIPSDAPSAELARARMKELDVLAARTASLRNRPEGDDRVIATSAIAPATQAVSVKPATAP